MKTRKFRGRLYIAIPIEKVAADDVIFYIDGSSRCNFVDRVTKKSVFIRNHQGLLPKTKRIHRSCMTGCWRWHKNVDSAVVSD